mmetsp:Transcript_50694/g.107550  ORF Transcript_50694/g.107550 Transcript_50694/m.107550 type:complete len:127 (-) Transcript_50694:26-406(-)
MAVSQQDQKPTLPPLPKQSHKFFFDDSTDSTLPSPPTDSQTLDFDESMYSNHPPPPTGQTIAREDFADLASPPPPPPPALRLFFFFSSSLLFSTPSADDWTWPHPGVVKSLATCSNQSHWLRCLQR